MSNVKIKIAQKIVTIISVNYNRDCRRVTKDYIY